MSLFGSLMGDVEDDPFFGSHMRHMHQMNNMMNSLLSDPFGMFGGGSPFALMGPGHSSAMMPFMPQMPSLNRLYSGNLADMDGGMTGASSYSSSISIMSNGPGGKPQVFQQSSSTKIGPDGVKETRKTLQDTRTGTKKMSIGHHIGERAHVIEREQNVYSGDQEERQEFINLDEDEAEDFDREFQEKTAGFTAAQRLRLQEAPPARLALPPAPSSLPSASRASAKTDSTRRNLSDTSTARLTDSSSRLTDLSAPSSRLTDLSASGRRLSELPASSYRPAGRRPLRTPTGPLTAMPTSSGASVREVYGGSHPQRHRHKHHKNKHVADQ